MLWPTEHYYSLFYVYRCQISLDGHHIPHHHYDHLAKLCIFYFLFIFLHKPASNTLIMSIALLCIIDIAATDVFRILLSNNIIINSNKKISPLKLRSIIVSI